MTKAKATTLRWQSPSSSCLALLFVLFILQEEVSICKAWGFAASKQRQESQQQMGHPLKRVFVASALSSIVLLGNIDGSFPSLLSSSFSSLSSTVWAETGFDGTTLKACKPETNCVSSNYKEPPNRYMSPLKLVNDRDEAFRRAVNDLKRNALSTSQPSSSSSSVSIVEIVPKDYYIHLTVPGSTPASLDDVELLYGETIVNVRCEARVTLPPTPWCVKKNCINGNQFQRERVEGIATSILGLPASDQPQMEKAKWSPIFFNADRVPDTMDYDDDD